VAALKKAYGLGLQQVSPAAEGCRSFCSQAGLLFWYFHVSEGGKTFSYTRLLQTVTIPSRNPTQEKVEEAESNLIEFFHRSGYFTATVAETAVRPGMAWSTQYDINLKRHAKFGNGSSCV
jgi:hypothetical protein